MEQPRHRLGVFERSWLWLAGIALWLLFLTVRYRIDGEAALQERLASGARVVLVGWHGRLLLVMKPMAGYRPLVMMSESRDGERIAWLGERFGYGSVRGSSSRGGIRALLRMVREVSGGAIGGHVVDGPRGPAGEVKPGVILLASRSGAVIVPVYASCRPRWVAPSWDRLQVPLPFARLDVRIGEPFVVPPDLSGPEVEMLRLDLEKRMAEGYRQLEADGIR